MISGGPYTGLRALIRREVSKRFPDLTSGELTFMSQVAERDFYNYVLVEDDLLYEDRGYERVLARLIYQMKSDPMRLAERLSDWADVWGWKWRQRVKLVLGDDSSLKEEEKVFSEVAPVIGRIKGYDWFKKFALGSIVRAGEVCFTDTLAESLAKTAIYKVVKGAGPQKAPEIIEKNPSVVVDEIVERARKFRLFKGNLVVVRLDPDFFKQRSFAEWW